MLRPELQDMESFADGIDNIVETQKTIAEHYFADGSVDLACPPLRALLHIMRDGHYEGKTLQDQSFRAGFTAKALLESGWYKERLVAQRKVDKALWTKHVQYLQRALGSGSFLTAEMRTQVQKDLTAAKAERERIDDPSYAEALYGRIGVTPAIRLLMSAK